MQTLTETRSAGAELEADLRDICQRAEPDEALLSERRLAEQYSISHGTVRRVLDDLLADGLIYKVQGKGNFVAPPKPATQRAVIVYADTLADSAHPFFVRRLRGVMMAAQELDLRLEVFHCDLHLSNRQRLWRELAREQVRGVILPWVNTDALRQLRAANAEAVVVTTASSCPPLGASAVMIDYTSIGQQALQWLDGQGCRRPACVLAHGLSRHGVERAAFESSAEPVVISAQLQQPQVADIVARLERLQPDGLAFDDDHVAAAVLERYGAEVPIITHGNAGDAGLPIASAWLEVDGQDIGREIVHLLHARISGQRPSDILLSVRPRLLAPTLHSLTHD